MDDLDRIHELEARRGDCGSLLPPSAPDGERPTVTTTAPRPPAKAAGYPAEEAASRERLAYRIGQAPGLFLCAIRSGGGAEGDCCCGDRLVGFCCGTAAPAGPLSEESMARHDPGGSTACLHSVCVDAAERRHGVASAMLRAYLNYIQMAHPELQEARLLCKPPLVPLYQRAGFELLGLSPVRHGGADWLEMARPLGGEEELGKRQQQGQLEQQRPCGAAA